MRALAEILRDVGPGLSFGHACGPEHGLDVFECVGLRWNWFEELLFEGVVLGLLANR